MIEIFKNHKYLFVVITLAVLLRFWDLGVNPPHLTSDEAALGYNAYSILKTGRDEHGHLFPIVFQSFGDWKPGLYIYADVPFVALFGLNEFSTRAPGALSGVVAVLLIYLIVNGLFPRSKIGVLSSFFLAISPWHLQFTRGAWEAGVALTLLLAGILFFIKAVKDCPRWLILSFVFFALTLWTYQGAKLSSTIVAIGLILVFKKEVLKIPKLILLKSFLIGFLVSLPVILSLFQGKTGRLDVYSVFSYRRSEKDIQEILRQDSTFAKTPVDFAYHSEELNFARGILGRWLNYYSGKFLLFEGDWSNPRHGVPNAGVILVVDGILLILGLFALSRMSGSAIFVWYLLILTPLPAALSRDSIHAVRSLDMVVPLVIILALGANFLFELGKKSKRIFFIPILLFYLINYVYYLDQYWVHAPMKNSESWQYGYKQMVGKLTPLQSKYQEIVVKQDYTQPYIFFLFYKKFDPAEYQKIVNQVYVPNSYGDVGLVSKFENVTFRDINWSADRGMHGKMFVMDPIKVPVEDSSDPKEFKLVDEIKYLDGRTAFRFVEVL